MFGLGTQELLIILVLVLIFFGAQKIPDLARSLGKGISEFRKAQKEIKDELTKEAEAPVSADRRAPMSVIVCPACKKETAAGPFCSQCGRGLAALETCRFCQRPLQPGDKFCSGCGQPH